MDNGCSLQVFWKLEKDHRLHKFQDLAAVFSLEQLALQAYVKWWELVNKVISDSGLDLEPLDGGDYFSMNEGLWTLKYSVPGYMHYFTNADNKRTAQKVAVIVEKTNNEYSLDAIFEEIRKRQFPPLAHVV